MLTITSGDCQRHFGTYSDKALKEPVSITRNGRERLVLLSVEEYRRLKKRSREALSVTDLSDADLEAISKSEVPAQYAHLDDEIR